MPHRIGVIGAINIDIHLFDARGVGHQAELVAGGYLASAGGKGSNQARAAARLGADVMLVGRVGDDEFGTMSLDALDAAGVDRTFVTVTTGKPTGLVVLRLDAGQHSSLIEVAAANAQLTWADIEPALSRLEQADALLIQAEVPPDVLEAVVEWCQPTGIPMFLDPAPPQMVTLPAMAAAEAITPDIEEATVLTGRPLSTDTGAALAVFDLLGLGARRVLAKLDDRGVIVGDADGLWQVPTARVAAVDETGAGDVFIAAVAVRRTAGADWLEAARFANAASAVSVAGAGLTLPDADEVARTLAHMDGRPRRIRPSSC